MTRLLCRLLIGVALLVFSACPALAQRGGDDAGPPVPREIHGQVRFAEGSAPADKVLVRVEGFGSGLSQQVFTDRTGKFRFPGLAPATYIVSVHSPGYRDAQQQVDLQTATSDYVLFQLVAERRSGLEASPKIAGATIDVNVPAEARKEYEKGRDALLSNNDADAGIRFLEKAVGLYPNYVEAHFLLGTAYMDKRQWDKAGNALRRALAINPKTTAAFFALGEVYRQQKKYTEAVKQLQEGLKLDERSAPAHFNLGRVYWEMNDIAKAGPQVGRALQLNPKLADAHLLAGNILLRAHKPEDALEQFEDYLRLAPHGEFVEQAKGLTQKIKQAMVEKR